MTKDYIGNRDFFVQLLKERVTAERLAHCFRVEETAIELARRYGVDPAKAGLAGLLHDLTKDSDNIKLAEKYGIICDTPKTLHGHTAAAYLKSKGYVDDDEVLEAIRWHTTGRAGMTMLDKVIYVADGTEPAREFPGVEDARKYAFENIDKAVLMGLKISLLKIVHRRSIIDNYSVEAYNYYRKLFPEGEV